jgi:polyhydroxybutyrate depolymerase
MRFFPIVFLLLAACEGPTTNQTLQETFRGYKAEYNCIDWQGQRRCYYEVPPNIKPGYGKPVGLVVVLHPSKTPVDVIERTAHIAAKATYKANVVIYPEGVDGQWNDGRIATKTKTYQLGTNDVGFLEKIISSAQREYGLTPKQTYLAGMSNGGMMVLRMACQSDSFASGAAVVANLPKRMAHDCLAKAKPLMLVFGTQDDVVKYEGGVLADSGDPKDYGEVLSAVDTERFFMNHYGCAPTRLMVGELANKEIDDTVARVRQYENCSEAPLRVITVEGMGHTWPGEPSRIASFVTGRGAITRQFDATEEILKFFSEN